MPTSLNQFRATGAPGRNSTAGTRSSQQERALRSPITPQAMPDLPTPTLSDSLMTMLADDPPPNVTTSSAVGTSVQAAREDHTHGGRYTDEEAQDAVGTILADSATIDFTYLDAAPAIGADVKADSITNTILANMAAWTFKIRNAGSSGDPADAALADFTGVTPAGTDYVIGFLSTGEIRKYLVSALMSGIIPDGDKGDITVSSTGTVWTIDPDVVTFAKMQNITTDRLLGRDTAGSGDTEEISVGGGIEFTGGPGIQRSALTGDVTASAGSNSTTVIAASDTQAGKVELATITETNTGTDATRAVTPDGLAGSIFGTFVIGLPLGMPTDAIGTGDGKTYFPVPSEMNGMNLIGVQVSVATASSSGTPTYQIRRVRSAASADMLSTKVTIDANEVDSSTATTPAVIDTSNDDVATGDQIYVDKDVAGTGELGDFITLKFRLP